MWIGVVYQASAVVACLSRTAANVAFPVACVAADYISHTPADIGGVIGVPVAAASHTAFEIAVGVGWIWFTEVRSSNIDSALDFIIVVTGLDDCEVVRWTQRCRWYRS